MRLARTLVGPLLLFASSLCFAGSYDDFFMALRQDNALAVSALLDRGFDPNTADPSGENGLILALRIRSEKVARILANAKDTEVEIRNRQDESPLMMAALRGYVEICANLIARDADVNKPGWTPLHYAATGGHLAVLRLLLDNHAYIDAESPNGSTPLMMAAMYSNAATVELLLKEGADPNLKNELGLTALDFAVRGKKPDSAELLEAVVRTNRTGGTW